MGEASSTSTLDGESSAVGASHCDGVEPLKPTRLNGGVCKSCISGAVASLLPSKTNVSTGEISTDCKAKFVVGPGSGPRASVVSAVDGDFADSFEIEVLDFFFFALALTS